MKTKTPGKNMKAKKSEPKTFSRLAPIPTRSRNPEGLHRRYIVYKTNGDPVDDRAEYFILRLDLHGKDPNHIAACRMAIHTYADAIEPFIPKLATDLRRRYPKMV